MPDLLFELGCEELPATFVKRAFQQLEAEIVRRLDESGLGHGASRSMGTPRRLIVGVEKIDASQKDQKKETRGPSIKAAFDESGAPTKALEGFCRSAGVTPKDLRNDGEYVWADKEIKGRPATEVLAEVIPAAIRALTFDKTMRWGQSRMRFARPVRWMLASLDGKLVSFDVEGVPTGLTSRGHRFDSPAPFQAKTWDTLASGLRKRNVEPDPAAREKLVREQAAKVASGSPELPAALVEENVYLTEWPVCHEGTFPESYLELPEPVLVTAMAKHERFFPVRGKDGRLLPKFVSVRNAGDEATVRSGNEWVLNARFNDAKFFYDEDKRTTLAGFLEKTRRMAFQEKLGSVLDRSARLADLTAAVYTAAGGDPTGIEDARQAGHYAKADLSTGLVGELASLQGMVGADYGRREGLPEATWMAIGAQYDVTTAAALPSGRARTTALSLVVADQLDKLAGFLGIGLVPSGSSDPYGLRRAVTMLIEAAWALSESHPFRGYDNLWKEACAGYARHLPAVALDSEAAGKALVEIFLGRYDALLTNIDYDVRLAVAEAMVEERHPTARVEKILDPVRFLACCRVAQSVKTMPALVQALARPSSILAAARKKGLGQEVDAAYAKPPMTLIGLADGIISENFAMDWAEAWNALSAGEVEHAAGLLAGLAAPINAFFEGRMVLTDDEAQRRSNFEALVAVERTLNHVADFGRIVIEG